MKKILIINSSVRNEKSHSRRLVDQVLNTLQARHGEAEITIRDVAETPLPHFDLHAFEGFAGVSSKKSKMAVERSDRLIAELQSSDAIIIGAPVYNYSIPSTLKAWIDHITRAGITFRYSEKGPQGLVTGKKVYVVTARGGGPVEHIEMQIAETFKMMGMTDIQFLHAGNLDSPEQASLIHSNYGNEKVTSITGNDQISSMEFLEA